MHYCLNVVTEKKNNPCAVLIRALEPMKTRPLTTPTHQTGRLFKRKNVRFVKKEKSKNILNGPAKLCRKFKIDKKLNGWDLTIGKKLWIEKGENIKSSQIKKSKRIGVNYAGIWKDRLLRFYIKNNNFVSKK